MVKNSQPQSPGLHLVSPTSLPMAARHPMMLKTALRAPLMTSLRNNRLHDSYWQPDEPCIGYGVPALSRAALGILA